MRLKPRVLNAGGVIFIAMWSCTPPAGPGAVLNLEELPDLTPPRCDAASLMPLGAPGVVNTTTAAYQRRPRVLVLTNGRFVASWASEDQDGDEHGVFLRVLDTDGTPLTEEIQVNQDSSNDQDFPALTALADGRFVVAWQSGPFFWEDLPSPDGSGTGIYARIFDGDGMPLTDEFLVNDHAVHDQLEVQLSTLEDGSFLAVWTSAREFEFSEGAFGTDGFLAVKRFNADGQVMVEETVAQENEVIGSINLKSEPRNADIVALEGGRFALTWQQARLHPDEMQIGLPYPIVVRARVYDSDGRAVSDVIDVSQQSNAESTNEYDPRITALPGGGFVVAWHSTRPSGNAVLMRHFDRNGTPRDAEYVALPRTGRSSLSVLALDVVQIAQYGAVLGAVMRTEDNGQMLLLQMFDAAGVAFGEPAAFEIGGSTLQTLSLDLSGGDAMGITYVVDAEEFADRDDIEVRLFGCP